MIQQQQWTDRKFAFDLPIEMFPCILERFRGTPARLEETLTPLSREACTTRIEGRWSIQEHAGHLLDTEEVSSARVADYQAEGVLTPADVNNPKTEEALHNAKELRSILAGFRTKRSAIVRILEHTTAEEAGRVALHARLKIPVRLIDHLSFICEHDDHHLAKIRRLIMTLSEL